MTQDEVNKLILQKELKDEDIPGGWKMDNTEPGPRGIVAGSEKSADAAFAFIQIGKKDLSGEEKEIIPY